jgi:hypothetical protein
LCLSIRIKLILISSGVTWFKQTKTVLGFFCHQRRIILSPSLHFAMRSNIRYMLLWDTQDRFMPQGSPDDVIFRPPTLQRYACRATQAAQLDHAGPTHGAAGIMTLKTGSKIITKLPFGKLTTKRAWLRGEPEIVFFVDT